MIGSTLSLSLPGACAELEAGYGALSAEIRAQSSVLSGRVAAAPRLQPQADPAGSADLSGSVALVEWQFPIEAGRERTLKVHPFELELEKDAGLKSALYPNMSKLNKDVCSAEGIEGEGGYS